MTVKKISKIYKTNDRSITQIINQSDNKMVLFKLKHPNYGKHIKQPKRNEGILCEECGSDNNVCFNKMTQKYLCGRHRSQISSYNKILERTNFDRNEIVLYEDHAEIILLDKEYQEVGRAIISLDKVDKIKNIKFHLRPDGYVETRIDKKIVLLHRYILDVLPDDFVDHIDRNKLNNLNNNLRIVCASESSVNRGLQSNNTSGVTGVTWDKSRDKWKVSINMYNECYNLGRYDDLDEAVAVRLEAEKIYHREFTPIERRDDYPSI